MGVETSTGTPYWPTSTQGVTSETTTGGTPSTGRPTTVGGTEESSASTWVDIDSTTGTPSTEESSASTWVEVDSTTGTPSTEINTETTEIESTTGTKGMEESSASIIIDVDSTTGTPSTETPSTSTLTSYETSSGTPQLPSLTPDTVVPSDNISSIMTSVWPTQGQPSTPSIGDLVFPTTRPTQGQPSTSIIVDIDSTTKWTTPEQSTTAEITGQDSTTEGQSSTSSIEDTTTRPTQGPSSTSSIGDLVSSTTRPTEGQPSTSIIVDLDSTTLWTTLGQLSTSSIGDLVSSTIRPTEGQPSTSIIVDVDSTTKWTTPEQSTTAEITGQDSTTVRPTEGQSSTSSIGDLESTTATQTEGQASTSIIVDVDSTTKWTTPVVTGQDSTTVRPTQEQSSTSGIEDTTTRPTPGQPITSIIVDTESTTKWPTEESTLSSASSPFVTNPGVPGITPDTIWTIFNISETIPDFTKTTAPGLIFDHKTGSGGIPGVTPSTLWSIITPETTEPSALSTTHSTHGINTGRPFTTGVPGITPETVTTEIATVSGAPIKTEPSTLSTTHSTHGINTGRPFTTGVPGITPETITTEIVTVSGAPITTEPSTLSTTHSTHGINTGRPFTTGVPGITPETITTEIVSVSGAPITTESSTLSTTHSTYGINTGRPFTTGVPGITPDTVTAEIVTVSGAPITSEHSTYGINTGRPFTTGVPGITPETVTSEIIPGKTTEGFPIVTAPGGNIKLPISFVEINETFIISTNNDWIIPLPCFYEKKKERFTIIFDLLLQSVSPNVNVTLLHEFKLMVNRPDIEDQLIFFDSYNYRTQEELLKRVLAYLMNSTNLTHNEIEAILHVRDNIILNSASMRLPTFAIECYKYDVTETTMIGLIYDLININCNNMHSNSEIPVIKLPNILSILANDTPYGLKMAALQLFRSPTFHVMIKNTNILGMTNIIGMTKGAILRNVFTSLTRISFIPENVKLILSSLQNYINNDNDLQEIIVACNAHITTNNTSVNIIDWLIVNMTVPEITVDFCAFHSEGVQINITDLTSLINLIQPDAPQKAKVILYTFLSQSLLLKKLANFNISKYSCKGELLQGLLVHLWLSPIYEYEIRDAAKVLLPFVQLDESSLHPATEKIICINPITTEILSEFGTVTNIPANDAIMIETNKSCSYLNLNIHATVYYRVSVKSIYKAVRPTVSQTVIGDLINFLRTPTGKLLLNQIHIDEVNTNYEFVKELVMVFENSQSLLPTKIYNLIMIISSNINTQGKGLESLYKEEGCKPNDYLLNGNFILTLIPPNDITSEIKRVIHIIIDIMSYSNMSLSDSIPWIPSHHLITIEDLLEIILINLEHQNPDLGKHITILLLYIRDKEMNAIKSDNSTEISRLDMEYKTRKAAVNKTRASFKIDYPDLLKIIKPNVPKLYLDIVTNFFNEPDFEKYLQGFNPENFTTQGILLNQVFMYLINNVTISSEVKEALVILLPFIDQDDLGSLPPTIHKVYVKTKTEVNIVTLDFGNIFKAIPRKNLTTEGKAALDAIFKYLSSPNINVKELMRGINSQQNSRIQLKIILLKLKQLASAAAPNLAPDIDTVLNYLQNELASEMSVNAQPLPNLDWLSIMHAIPDDGAPPEVLWAKKDLYSFFISKPFRKDMDSYLVNIEDGRGEFLKQLLSYIRIRFDGKALKQAIAYITPFVHTDGTGSVPILNDIIQPEEEEEAVHGEARFKELLYQIPDLLPRNRKQSAPYLLRHLQQMFTTTKRMQRGSTFIGLDVLSELSDKEQLLVLLRRVRHNYKLFLDDGTIAAINTVLQLLHEENGDNFYVPILDINLTNLVIQAIGTNVPPEIMLSTNELAIKVPPGSIILVHAFQDLQTSINNAEPKNKLTVVLRILWRIFSQRREVLLMRHVKSIYEYLKPTSSGMEISGEKDHLIIINALNKVIRENEPTELLKAKNNIINELRNQNKYDRVLSNIISQNLSATELIARTLRRFREHQRVMNPTLWTSVSIVFDYLKIMEHDSSEDESDDSLNIVNEFKNLVEEAGEKVSGDKDTVIKFMIEKKNEILQILRGHRILFQYPPREKMVIIFRRLLHIYQNRMQLNVVSAIKNILKHLESSDGGSNEIFADSINISALLDDVVANSSDMPIRNAKNVLKKLFEDNPQLTASVINGVIIQEKFNVQRRLAVLLRRAERKFQLHLTEDQQNAFNTLFSFLQTSPDSSVEDQFVGDVKFDELFNKVFGGINEGDDVHKARQQIVKLLSSKSVNFHSVLRGLHLWKLEPETQVGLILYRLIRYAQLSPADNNAVLKLLDTLDIDIDEAAAEDRDESFKPSVLFADALRGATIPPAVAEARGILLHLLNSGGSTIRDIYRGIDFERYQTPVSRLTALLRNVYLRREQLGHRVSQALKVISDYLHISVSEGNLDPYTYDFSEVFDIAVPSFAPQIVHQAKLTLIEAIKKRPGFFKKMLNVQLEENENELETAKTILNAMLSHKRQLSMKLRTAISLIMKFMYGEHIDENDMFIKHMLVDYDYNENDETQHKKLSEEVGYLRSNSNKVKSKRFGTRRKY